MEKNWFGLLDCNNFFVSCERLFRPDLLGKPVVVLSGNDGCIVARSQEVKDMKIPMGVPYFQVKDTLEKANTTVFSSHFALYRDVSRRVFEAMRAELSLVQQYSIDEAFFAVAEPSQTLAMHVKQSIETRVGIPVSVAIAPTKTLAKLTSLAAKKGTGGAVFAVKQWPETSYNVPIESIWGVGGRLEMLYKQQGILSAGDLINADSQRVKTLFGINGLRLQKELLGEPVYSLLDKVEPQKSIMSSRSFAKNTTELPVLADALAFHVRHAMEDLRAMNQKTQAIRVSITTSRHGDFMLRGGSAEAVLSAPTNDTIAVLTQAQKLLKGLYEPGVPYKKAGIVLSQFSTTDIEQSSLFAPEQQVVKTDVLMPIIDILNKKIGKDSITVGNRLRSDSWQSKVDVRSPAYTTRWSDIQSARAK